MELSASTLIEAHLGCDVNIRALEARFEFVSAADGSGNHYRGFRELLAQAASRV